MDPQVSALSSAGRDGTDDIAAVQSPDVAVEEKKPNVAISDEDRVNQMTLKTATVPKMYQPQNTKVVTRQPGATPAMKPENYVVNLEHLRETPDYIDCPHYTNHYCEGCKKCVAHKPHEGKMEAVLPAVSTTSPGGVAGVQLSQYADMTEQSRQRLEPGTI
ncbi:hypothetical protein ACHAQJ_000823 [Trichoderma viride]